MANDGDTNIAHVNIIEGLINETRGHLEAISATTVEQAEVKDAARNKLVNWEEFQLFALRKEFEE